MHACRSTLEDPTVSGPGAYTNQTSGAFRFAATTTGPADAIGFSFRFDTDAYSPFDTVKTATFTSFAEGAHKLDVRARDPSGLADSASFAFTIDLTPPETNITGGIAEGGYTNSEPVEITFDATDNLSPAGEMRFRWSLDGSAFTTPSSARTASFPGLAEGPHTFEVYAIDAAGNIDATSEVRHFTVDRTLPVSAIVSGPGHGALVTAPSVRFRVTGSDNSTPLSRIEWMFFLDGGAITGFDTTSSVTLAGLNDGVHRFSFLTRDLAGNQTTEDTSHFVVDTRPVQGPSLIQAQSRVFAVNALEITKVALADMDSDGRPDVVVSGRHAQPDSGGIRLLLTLPDGSLLRPVPYGHATMREATIADVDGDGHPDVITLPEVTSAPDSGWVFLGSTGGVLQTPLRFAIPPRAASIGAIDLNGDSAPDLVIATESTNDVRLLIGDGHGRFTPGGSIPLPFPPRNVAVGDLNGDLRGDVAVACDRQVSILYSNGDGTFAPRLDVSIGNVAPSSIVLGNLNQDNLPDLAVSANPGVLILPNTGSGFGPATSLSGQVEGSLSVGDLDGDGRNDLLALGSNELAAWLANGQGGFGPVTYGSTLGGGSLSIGDLDLDGSLDAVAAGSGTIDVHHGKPGKPAHRQVDEVDGLRLWGRPALGDLNGDGALDLVGGTYRQVNNFVWTTHIAARMGVGDGSFGPEVLLGEIGKRTWGVEPALGDLDLDGALDIVAVSVDSGTVTPNVVILLGRGDGSFLPRTVYALTGYYDPPNLQIAAARIADVTGDGIPDVVVPILVEAGQGPGAIWILRGTGGGAFAPPSKYSLPGFYPNHVELSDLNGDGRPDLVVAGQDELGYFGRVLLNDGAGGFTPSGPNIPGLGQFELTDMDGDSHPDLVGTFTDISGQWIGVAAGNGAGGFGTPTSIGSGDGVTAFDLNGDGRPDLAGTSDLGTLRIWLGRPGAPPVYQGDYGQAGRVGYTGDRPSAGDVDADGDLDLVSPTLSGLSDAVHGVYRNLTSTQNSPPNALFSRGTDEQYFPATTVSFGWLAMDDHTPLASLRFAYRVDSLVWSAFSPETSVVLNSLSEGRHSIDIRVKDGAGLEDPTPAHRTFYVDLTPPDATVLNGPSDNTWINTETATFVMSGTDNLAPAGLLSYASRVGAGAFGTPVASSTVVVPGVPEGRPTVEIRVQDPAGNVDPTPVARTFNVDRTPPETQLLSGPAANDTVTTNSLTYGWSGTDDRSPVGTVRFEYRVDGSPFEGLTNAGGGSLSNVADGPHTFEVRAVDLAGNRDATPASRPVVVDALGPVVNVVGGPGSGACLVSDTLSFTWTAADAITPRAMLAFASRIDNDPTTPFSPDTMAVVAGLAEGVHMFTALSRDERGHVGTTSRTFQVDRTAPVPFAPTAQVRDASLIQFTCTGSDNFGITRFHLRISTDPTFATVLHEQDLAAPATFDYTGIPGNTYFGRATATDCAGNVSGYGPVSNNATLADLPDLAVTSIVVPPAAVAAQVMQVEFTVANQAIGATTTPQWFDDVYLSPTPTFDPATAILLDHVQNLTYLAKDETYTIRRQVHIPVGVQGNWRVLVFTDHAEQVPETSSGNNLLASSAVAVTLGAVANLEVTSVIAPPTGVAAGTALVRWTVRNNGDGRTPVDRWFDTVLMSNDDRFDFALVGSGGLRVMDTPLAFREHVGALEVGASYSDSTLVTWPADVQGLRWLIVASDLQATQLNQVVPERGLVFEDLAERNFAVAESTDVILLPPPDLVVTDLTMPAGQTLTSGGPLSLQWTVKNQGFSNTSANAWTDRVYLSADATLDGSDLLLGQFPQSLVLAVGKGYSVQPTVLIPNGVSGSRYLIVQTDVYGQQPEFLESNNVRAHAQVLSIALSPWPNLVPVTAAVPDTVSAGGTVQAQWQVENQSPNGRSLAGSWRDDIYLSSSPVWSPASAWLLAAQRTTQSLVTGQGYTQTATADIPVEFAGIYHVFVVTDVLNEVFEHTQEGDNVQELATLFVRPYPAVDVRVAGVTVAANAVGTGDALPVEWGLENIGEGTTRASQWREEVWLSTDTVLQPGVDRLLASPTHGGVMLSGGAATGSVTASVPEGVSGDYYILVRTDAGNANVDVDLANNIGASAAPVHITSAPAPPRPDLEIPSITVTGTDPTGAVVSDAGTAGQPIHISWSVRNAGPGAGDGRAWSVGVYLSQDTRLDGTDLTLGSAVGPTGLAPGAVELGALDVELPGYVAGAYFVLVVADVRNEVAESDEADNLSLRPFVSVLPPASNLLIRDVTVGSPTAVPGQPVAVSYTLENIGVNPAIGLVQNGVYMSADTTFDSIEDPLVGIEATTINLPAGGVTKLRQFVKLVRLPTAGQPGGVTGNLPPLDPGPYHAVVQANIRGNIRELNLADNQSVSPSTVQSTIPFLTLDVPELFELPLAAERYYQVTVSAGQDLFFTLGTDVDAATNQMFVAFGRTPTPADYDFAGPAEFTAQPSIVVPGTQTGTYHVVVIARGLGSTATTQQVSLTARLLPFSITSHEPAVGGAGGQVTARVRGAGLRGETVLQLEQGGEVKATAQLVEFKNSTDLRVRYDLKNVKEGVYDVVAVNGGDRVVVAGGFVVETARPRAVEIVHRHADVLRRTAQATFEIGFHNTSNQDVPVLRARLIYPGGSRLRRLDTSPGLFSRSERMPGLFAPLAGDFFVVRNDAKGDSLAIIDLLGGTLAPGETRTVIVGLTGLDSSPYSISAMAEAATVAQTIDRETALGEAARIALLREPDGSSPELRALAADDQAFREQVLTRGLGVPGIIDEAAIDHALANTFHGIMLPTTDPGGEGPENVLAEALAADCAVPGTVPECVPDLSPVACALPGCRLVFPAPLPVGLPFDGGVVVELPSTTVKGYSIESCADVQVVAPCDPNKITGPVGFGADKWVGLEDDMTYRVDFENLASDTVHTSGYPAQVVVVDVPIDTSLDISSFRLKAVGFGGPDGPYVPTVDNDGEFAIVYTNGSQGLPYPGISTNVQITAGIDPSTRRAHWRFTSLVNGVQPANGSIGFLPVNDNTGRGQGFVEFFVRPRSNGFPGARVNETATVRFDANATLTTNTYGNRLDSRRPGSLVRGFQVLDTTRVRISWTGQDDPTGAGLRSYDVYLRKDVGQFSRVAQGLTTNIMDLTVQPGHQYAMYTLAQDNAKNLEPGKTTPDQLVIVGTIQLAVDPKLPRVTALYQNAPNPWQGETRIRFDLARDAQVTLEVFDVQGRIVARPLDGKFMPAGHHSVDLSRLNGGPGVYFYRLNAESFRATRRMIKIQ